MSVDALDNHGMFALQYAGYEYWLFAGLCVVALAAVTMWLRRLGLTGRHAAMVWLVMITALFAAMVHVHDENVRAHEQIKKYLTALVPTYALELQDDGHALINENTPPDDPAYLRLDACIMRWGEANPLTHGIYTMRRRRKDGKIIIIMDPASDLDGNGKIEGELEGRTPIGELYDGNDPAMDEAFAGRLAFSAEPVTDKWGRWVSAYYPVRNSTGKVEAIVGVDYRAEDYEKGAAAARVSSIGLIAPLMLLLVTSTIVITVMKWNLEQRKIAGAELSYRNDLLDHQNQETMALQQELLAQNEQLRDNEQRLAEALRTAERSRELHAVAARRFEELFHGLPIACLTYDLDGNIFEWNRAAEDLYGLKAHEVLYKSIYSTVLDPEQSERCKLINNRVFDGESVSETVWQCRRADGSTGFVLTKTFPLHGPQGGIVAALSAHTDITDLKNHERNLIAQSKQIEDQLSYINEMCVQLNCQQEALEEANGLLKQLATTDSLTGVNNHRAFTDRLAASIAGAKRDKTTLSVIMLDVDNFKMFNDTFGHPEGDKVLVNAAQVLTKHVRPTDFVARYGGEEFVVILPKCTAAEALRTAERLRAEFEGFPWAQRKVTASFGVATRVPSDKGAEELISQADQALYASKAAGRNRVTHYKDLDRAAA